jgi:hypothetical protein
MEAQRAREAFLLCSVRGPVVLIKYHQRFYTGGPPRGVRWRPTRSAFFVTKNPCTQIYIRLSVLFLLHQYPLGVQTNVYRLLTEFHFTLDALADTHTHTHTHPPLYHVRTRESFSIPIVCAGDGNRSCTECNRNGQYTLCNSRLRGHCTPVASQSPRVLFFSSKTPTRVKRPTPIATSDGRAFGRSNNSDTHIVLYNIRSFDFHPIRSRYVLQTQTWLPVARHAYYKLALSVVKRFRCILNERIKIQFNPWSKFNLYQNRISLFCWRCYFYILALRLTWKYNRWFQSVQPS